MQTSDHPAAAYDCISLFNRQAGLVSLILWCPGSFDVWGPFCIYCLFMEHCSEKWSILTKRLLDSPLPKKGCVDGPRVYKESSFGRSYRAPTDILRLCWKEELVHVTTIWNLTAPLWQQCLSVQWHPHPLCTALTRSPGYMKRSSKV